MDWATQFDVTESFQALEDVDETISVQDLQTIYLGLGFLPTRFATVENLTRAVHRQQTMERDAKQKQLQVLPSEGTIEEDDNGQNASSLVVGKRTSLYTEQLMDGRLTLEQTLLFLSKHPRKDREQELKAVFDKCWKSDHKDTIDVDQLLRVAERQVEGGWTRDQAERMLQHAKSLSNTRRDPSSKRKRRGDQIIAPVVEDSSVELSYSEFKQLFAVPPEPPKDLSKASGDATKKRAKSET